MNVFTNLQLLDAEFTDSQIPGQIGKTPAYSPSVLLKGGIQLSRDNVFDLAFTAVYVSDEFWADSNLGTPTIPAKIPPMLSSTWPADWKHNQECETHRRYFESG